MVVIIFVIIFVIVVIIGCGRDVVFIIRDFSRQGGIAWRCGRTECRGIALSTHADTLTRRHGNRLHIVTVSAAWFKVDFALVDVDDGTVVAS